MAEAVERHRREVRGDQQPPECLVHVGAVEWSSPLGPVKTRSSRFCARPTSGQPRRGLARSLSAQGFDRARRKMDRQPRLGRLGRDERPPVAVTRESPTELVADGQPPPSTSLHDSPSNSPWRSPVVTASVTSGPRSSPSSVKYMGPDLSRVEVGHLAPLDPRRNGQSRLVAWGPAACETASLSALRSTARAWLAVRGERPEATRPVVIRSTSSDDSRDSRT